MSNEKEKKRIIDVGPAGYAPPSAMDLGVEIPDPGDGLFYGNIVPEDKVIEETARQMYTRKNPTIFPGPLVMWAWDKVWMEKGHSVLRLAAEIPNVMMIPMPDYRPRYPTIEPEESMNPNHPNLTIWHNKIEVCLFIGVHCHYANLTLRIVRAGSNCLTTVICHDAHEDAMLSVRDFDVKKMDHIIDIFRRVRKELKIAMPKDGKTVRLTPLQIHMNGGKTHLNPLDIENPLNRLKTGRLEGERV
ncbi:MAG: 2-oxoglutarate:ferredoxin oxidoreductase [Nitrospirae bacterium]|nr:2-oxoglutarate:ferredoxin oxidoreductase [Nitrospirota bacterium]